MVSKTIRTESKRSRKHKNGGRARKNAMHNKGTTPPRAELFKVQAPESK